MKAIRMYAQVLVDVALAPATQFDLQASIRELTSFSKMFDESPALGKVFENPAIGESDRQKVLKELCTKVSLGESSTRFVNLLAKRNRLNLLSEIIKEVEVIEIEKKGGLIGEVVSAVALDAAVVTGISEALSKRLKKPVQLKQKVDTALIAGMRVTVSGVTYDGSVKGKIEKLSGII